MLSIADIKNIENSIKRHDAKTVALQVPEGLKTKVVGMAGDIEALSVNVLIFADPCFGACDIPDLGMKRFGCDLIVHVGHSGMVKKLALPVVYIEYFSDTDVTELLKKELDKLKDYKSIGLATTIQHIKEIPKVRNLLEHHKKTVYVGESPIAKYPGQVLGCDPGAALNIADKVDCILFFGTGRFHALGIAKKTDLPVLLLSLEDGRIYDLKAEQERLRKKKIILMHKFRDAKKVCIVASTKAGQMNRSVVSLKKRIEKTGKSAFIVVMDFISQENLLGMDYDIIVNTACPRIEEDLVFDKPLINAGDIFE
ncbi:MAG: diphthamide biosynthesis enzyme Dph2 [archaeon]